METQNAMMNKELSVLGNKFVYVKQNVLNTPKLHEEMCIDNQVYVAPTKILINPNHLTMDKIKESAHTALGPKVFINPHFRSNYVHVNPNFRQSSATVQKIHVNPKVVACDSQIKKIASDPSNNQEHQCAQTITTHTRDIKNIPGLDNALDSISSMSSKRLDILKGTITPALSKPLLSTKNKLIRVQTNTETQKIIKKRRSSIITKYKIVKSNNSKYKLSNNSRDKLQAKSVVKDKTTGKNKQAELFSKYKVNTKRPLQIENKQNIFKLDRRTTVRSESLVGTEKLSKRRFVFVNKYFSMGHIAKNIVLKRQTLSRPGYINVNGILYKKSPNSLRKSLSNRSIDHSHVANKTFCRSKYTLTKKSVKVCSSISPSASKQVPSLKDTTKLLKSRHSIKLLRTTKSKKVPADKLKISNMSCPMFRKFGRCSGKDNGACIKKHNPDQVMLCTKFLQGACINQNCLLSHKISPEKMPTCKYYLEGSCAREGCSYLHVKINPKADICKSFLEGFCEKATQCDKRHQFLCPEFEKQERCPRKRCPYPHGNRVRNFASTSKFAKKCSRSVTKDKDLKKSENHTGDKSVPINSAVKNVETKHACMRYYEESKSTQDNQSSDTTDFSQVKNQQTENCDFEIYVKNRPRLGDLPTYIPLFEEKS